MSKEGRINLTTEQRAQLETFIRTGNSPARSQTRARILLLADRSQGQERTDEEVAQAVLVSKHTVMNIRHRFHEVGLPAALYDKPRPGQPPKLTGELEAKLTVLACSDPPEGEARWTLRLLADRLIELGYIDYVSHVTVGGRTPVNRGHEHHLAMSAFSAAERRPRCLGGSQPGGGTR